MGVTVVPLANTSTFNPCPDCCGLYQDPLWAELISCDGIMLRAQADWLNSVNRIKITFSLNIFVDPFFYIAGWWAIKRLSQIPNTWTSPDVVFITADWSFTTEYRSEKKKIYDKESIRRHLHCREQSNLGVGLHWILRVPPANRLRSLRAKRTLRNPHSGRHGFRGYCCWQVGRISWFNWDYWIERREFKGWWWVLLFSGIPNALWIWWRTLLN